MELKAYMQAAVSRRVMARVEDFVAKTGQAPTPEDLRHFTDEEVRVVEQVIWRLALIEREED